MALSILRTPPEILSVPQFANGKWQIVADPVTVEVPLTIHWEQSSGGASPSGQCTLWAWPYDLETLALGHIVLDKLPSPLGVHRSAQVEARGERDFFVGVGEPLPGLVPAPPARWQAGAALAAMRAFLEIKGMWDGTGCFHRAGVMDVHTPTLLAWTEDIGRHNCVDRLAGWAIRTSTPLADKALLISARLTSSLCAKALRAGFRILVSRSAVTTAAITMATEAGATLIGFARTQESRFTLYCDPLGRILPTQELGSAPAV